MPSLTTLDLSNNHLPAVIAIHIMEYIGAPGSHLTALREVVLDADVKSGSLGSYEREFAALLTSLRCFQRKQLAAAQLSKPKASTSTHSDALKIYLGRDLYLCNRDFVLHRLDLRRSVSSDFVDEQSQGHDKCLLPKVLDIITAVQSGLLSLSLCHCHLNDDSAYTLCSTFVRHNLSLMHLQRLVLRYNHIGAGGIMYLAETLQLLRCLEVIDISQQSCEGTEENDDNVLDNQDIVNVTLEEATQQLTSNALRCCPYLQKLFIWHIDCVDSNVRMSIAPQKSAMDEDSHESRSIAQTVNQLLQHLQAATNQHGLKIHPSTGNRTSSLQVLKLDHLFYHQQDRVSSDGRSQGAITIKDVSLLSPVGMRNMLAPLKQSSGSSYTVAAGDALRFVTFDRCPMSTASMLELFHIVGINRSLIQVELKNSPQLLSTESLLEIIRAIQRNQQPDLCNTVSCLHRLVLHPAVDVPAALSRLGSKRRKVSWLLRILLDEDKESDTDAEVNEEASLLTDWFVHRRANNTMYFEKRVPVSSANNSESTRQVQSVRFLRPRTMHLHGQRPLFVSSFYLQHVLYHRYTRANMRLRGWIVDSATKFDELLDNLFEDGGERVNLCCYKYRKLTQLSNLWELLVEAVEAGIHFRSIRMTDVREPSTSEAPMIDENASNSLNSNSDQRRNDYFAEEFVGNAHFRDRENESDMDREDNIDPYEAREDLEQSAEDKKSELDEASRSEEQYCDCDSSHNPTVEQEESTASEGNTPSLSALLVSFCCRIVQHYAAMDETNTQSRLERLQIVPMMDFCPSCLSFQDVTFTEREVTQVVQLLRTTNAIHSHKSSTTAPTRCAIQKLDLLHAEQGLSIETLCALLSGLSTTTTESIVQSTNESNGEDNSKIVPQFSSVQLTVTVNKGCSLSQILHSICSIVQLSSGSESPLGMVSELCIVSPVGLRVLVSTKGTWAVEVSLPPTFPARYLYQALLLTTTRDIALDREQIATIAKDEILRSDHEDAWPFHGNPDKITGSFLQCLSPYVALKANTLEDLANSVAFHRAPYRRVCQHMSRPQQDQQYAHVFWSTFADKSYLLDETCIEDLVEIIKRISSIQASSSDTTSSVVRMNGLLLSLCNLGVTDELLRQLLSSLGDPFQCIQGLNVSANLLTNSSGALLGQYLNQSARLTALNMSYNAEITFEGRQQLLTTAIKPLRQLRYVYLHNREVDGGYYYYDCGLYDCHSMDAMDSMDPAVTLHRSNKRHTPTMADDLLLLRVVLQQHPTVLTAVLTPSVYIQPRHNNDAVFDQADSYRGVPLELRIETQTVLLTEEVKCVAEICSLRTSVRYLYVRRNGWQDDLAVYLAQGIMSLSGISAVDISYNNLSTVGLCEIATAILQATSGPSSASRGMERILLHASYNGQPLVIPLIAPALLSPVTQDMQRRRLASPAGLHVLQLDKGHNDVRVNTCAVGGSDAAVLVVSSLPRIRHGLELISACHEPGNHIPNDRDGVAQNVTLSLKHISTLSSARNYQSMTHLLASLAHDDDHTVSLILTHSQIPPAFLVGLSTQILFLRTLDLTDTQLDDTHGLHLEYALSSSTSRVKSLRSLYLRRNALTMVSFNALLSAIASVESGINEVDFAYNVAIDVLTKETAIKLAQRTRRLSLCLAHTSLNSASGLLLSHLLAGSLNFPVVDVAHQRGRPQHATAVSEEKVSEAALHAINPSQCCLVQLDLSYTQIDHPPLSSPLHILRALNHNKELRSLRMDGHSLQWNSNAMDPTITNEKRPLFTWQDSALQILSLQSCPLPLEVVLSIVASGARQLQQVNLLHSCDKYATQQLILESLLASKIAALPALQHLSLWSAGIVHGPRKSEHKIGSPEDSKQEGEDQPRADGNIDVCTDYYHVDRTVSFEDVQMTALQLLSQRPALRSLILYPPSGLQIASKEIANNWRDVIHHTAPSQFTPNRTSNAADLFPLYLTSPTSGRPLSTSAPRVLPTKTTHQERRLYDLSSSSAYSLPKKQQHDVFLRYHQTDHSLLVVYPPAFLSDQPAGSDRYMMPGIWQNPRAYPHCEEIILVFDHHPAHQQRIMTRHTKRTQPFHPRHMHLHNSDGLNAIGNRSSSDSIYPPPTMARGDTTVQANDSSLPSGTTSSPATSIGSLLLSIVEACALYRAHYLRRLCIYVPELTKSDAIHLLRILDEAQSRWPLQRLDVHCGRYYPRGCEPVDSSMHTTSRPSVVGAQSPLVELLPRYHHVTRKKGSFHSTPTKSLAASNALGTATSRSPPTISETGRTMHSTQDAWTTYIGRLSHLQMFRIREYSPFDHSDRITSSVREQSKTSFAGTKYRLPTDRAYYA